MDSKLQTNSTSKPSKPRFIFEEHNEFIKRERSTKEKLVLYPVINIDVVKEEVNEPEPCNNVDFPIETNLNNQVKVLNTSAPGIARTIKQYTRKSKRNNKSSLAPQLIESETQNVEIKMEPVEPFELVDIKENRVKIEQIDDSVIKIENEDTVPVVMDVRKVKKGYVACDDCEYQTSRRYSLINHITANHNKKKPKKSITHKYKCDFCDEKFPTIQQRQEHTKTHNGKGLFCGCGHGYWKLNHKRRNGSKFFCNLCEHQACSKSLLDCHIIEIHKMKSLTFKCNNCQSRFSEKSDLTAHLRAQDKNLFTGYKCSSKNAKKCNRYNDFTFDYDMYISKGKKSLFDSSNKQYECTQCSYKCALKQNLKTHMETHTNSKEKAYTCRFCKFRYSSYVGLDRHMMKVHPHKRPYFCKLCDCKYSRMNDLVRHIRSHFGRN
ncbi:transcriptional repressor CTCF-like [Maniola jurtina]|uniref:transcriptional repressor CTCF-like n=1 Tax=Maniola jurtina TaxID=191418 RepID=UPI001E6883AB|nr:transcriptional repressor CTCF-like [Maniola jurtina]